MTAPCNCARFAAAPLSHGGTPTELWRTAFASSPPPPLDLASCRHLVVAAPHPDDETLGFGATIAQLASAGVPVRVVSVSDGDAAHPGAPEAQRSRLAAVRRDEIRRATTTLRTAAPVELGLPDGELADHEPAIAHALTQLLQDADDATWCAATWRGDGHPDHEAVGRAAATACARTGATLLEYPVWMWHWAQPEDRAVPWDRAHCVPAPGWATARKRQAAQCYRSQFTSSGDEPAVLPPFVLDRLFAVGEVVFR
ncbi:LmbE family protein [Mycobacterium sp. E2462]|uniref:PIG-L deacetylase family protein n=1 Tax=Mycobacterium sp. E2462 TaxID=1834133 RepID=UPI000801354A|nr:PIG-L family deacetylase [Mycobacterium sp. E2462]OBI22244.1 LmbE family protein [Mycobacterium sp. E2462]